MMGATKHWTVEINIDEHEDQRRTQAEARLSKGSQDLRRVGIAQRNPHDREVPAIGDELAAARALDDLARKLRETAAGDIEQVTHQPAHLSA